MTIIKRKCEYCGKEFETTNEYKRFCDRRCKELGRNNRLKNNIYNNDIFYHKTCPICGKEFKTKVENKIYCSNKCCNKHIHDKYADNKHIELKDNFQLSYKNINKIKSNIKLFIKDIKLKEKEKRKIAICPICNEKFIKQNKYQKYCSRECSGINLRKYEDDAVKHLRRNFKDCLSYSLNRINGKYIHRVNICELNCENILDCTFEEYKMYLESLFQKDMNWDNFSNKKLELYWEIDHIIPRSNFEFFKDGELDITELYKCFNYKNTQPLWDYENRLKSNK